MRGSVQIGKQSKKSLNIEHCIRCPPQEMAEEKINSYINEKLLTEVKPVLFTDLISQFKLGPSKAKKSMYSYYKFTSTSNVNFNCILMCCYKDGTVKLRSDLNNATNEMDEEQDNLTDCFIYAFNPMEEFIPVNSVIEQMNALTIRNPFKLATSTLEEVKPIQPQMRSKTTDASGSSSSKTTHISSRSNTLPESKVESNVAGKIGKKPTSKSKSMGLQSTALLSKMREAREARETERQLELRKRREDAIQKRTKSDPKRKAQMDELNKLFVDDEDEDEDEEEVEIKETATESDHHPVDMENIVAEQNNINEKDEQGSGTGTRVSSSKIATTNVSELEELLNTTTEDSILEIKKDGEKPNDREEKPFTSSSYVDEDGYIVTKRPATSTPPQPAKKRQTHSVNTIKSKRPASVKKKQGSIESFFKRS
ncbi:hypothetical protein NCAS_0A08310 [Naumovozyma castellii]|uniref:DNA polymerase delta subunit 3 n=1 Tax=Naumovozyma castellii TaxID=27288 RepID=G0V7E1_NAUCA|nr:hypothetical protein NCAS_0A08310 [Naumovozyma castellii CBS 4309]CCC67389.1 hypothetical protein NCAS_0A08310 [Naumovozyma castellii CBS 4309]